MPGILIAVIIIVVALTILSVLAPSGNQRKYKNRVMEEDNHDRELRVFDNDMEKVKGMYNRLK